jgi:hypothetical protein
MHYEWDKAAFAERMAKSTRPTTPREMKGMSLTKLAEWSIEQGWAPKESYAEIERVLDEAIQANKEGEMAYIKEQTAGAARGVGCHLCGAKTVKRVTKETLKKRKVDGERVEVWSTTITKSFECGTVASQTDDALGRTQVKVGKACIDISELTGAQEAAPLAEE